MDNGNKTGTWLQAMGLGVMLAVGCASAYADTEVAVVSLPEESAEEYHCVDETAHEVACMSGILELEAEEIGDPVHVVHMHQHS